MARNVRAIKKPPRARAASNGAVERCLGLWEGGHLSHRGKEWAKLLSATVTRLHFHGSLSPSRTKRTRTMAVPIARRIMGSVNIHMS
jgi:hypothetical protein